MTFVVKNKGGKTGEANFIVPQVNEVPVNQRIPANLFGTPMYDNLYFEPGSYTDLDGSVISYEGVQINAVLLMVEQSRNIVKTSIQGRNGTIKEYISDGDYMITASGLLTGVGNEFPEQESKALNEISIVPQQVKVTSEFLNEVFGISYIVIEKLTVAQKQGSRNEIGFSMQALSDNDIDLDEIIL
jgi:hypothetical protein